MHYQIITDHGLLTDFINNVLPDTEEHEQFYCCLFARKKYCKTVPWIKSDKAQLKRFTATKRTLAMKIRQLECPLGSYQVGGGDVPQEALAFYLTPNPRNLWRSTMKGLIKLATVIDCDGRNSNPHQEILSVIQQTKSRTVWVTFDIDQKGEDVITKVNAALGGDTDCRLILETRGGYHVLVSPGKVPKAFSTTWHCSLNELSDVTGDSMIPVPGTYQGGFTPHFI